jgi:hypothetical protein
MHWGLCCSTVAGCDGELHAMLLAEPPSSYSTVGQFPGSDYAPYSQRDYVWNRAAAANAYPSSSSWFSAPAFLLSPEMAADARDRAAYNAKQVSYLTLTP